MSVQSNQPIWDHFLEAIGFGLEIYHKQSHHLIQCALVSQAAMVAQTFLLLANQRLMRPFSLSGQHIIFQMLEVSSPKVQETGRKEMESRFNFRHTRQLEPYAISHDFLQHTRETDNPLLHPPERRQPVAQRFSASAGFWESPFWRANRNENGDHIILGS